MPTTTTNYSLYKPLVADPIDEDLWGDYLNDNADLLDGLLKQGIATTIQSSQTSAFTATVSISARVLYPCDATSASFAVTLPTAAAAGNGATVYFQKIDSTSNAVTITRASTDTIDGATTYALSSQYAIVGLVSDGASKWVKIVSATTNFVGDSGSGGVAGLVPAPAAGDAASAKVLGAGGAWISPTSSGNATSAPQVTSTSSHAVYTGSHTIPFNDSAMSTSNSEQILSATASVTSASVSDFLEFKGNICFDTATSGTPFVVGIFRDSETTAIAQFSVIDSSNNHIEMVPITFRQQAIDTSAHTYSVRAGTESGNAFYINGDNTGRKYGGTLLTYLQVTPVKA